MISGDTLINLTVTFELRQMYKKPMGVVTPKIPTSFVYHLQPYTIIFDTNLSFGGHTLIFKGHGILAVIILYKDIDRNSTSNAENMQER